MMRKKAPSKAETKLLELFEGLRLDQIVVPSTVKQYQSALCEIKSARIIGFDTESKPVFKKEDTNEGPHVVQFAIEDKAFIFQVYRTECHPYLNDIFQSEEIQKVGFGLKSDHRFISDKFGVQMRATLDLDSIFRKMGYRGDTGARAAAGLMLNRQFHKSKRATTSNWALTDLSPAQLLYSANDAYIALKVFHALIEDGLKME